MQHKEQQINAYLTFNGNCKEAMTFYQKCIGGELNFQTVAESPLSIKMPRKIKDCILHSTLTNDNFVLMGSDMVSERGLMKGNTISLILNCVSEVETKRCFRALSKAGTIDHPLEINFVGALFGDLTDKFGNHWILNFKD